MKLTILIPVYNEIKTLPLILEKISKIKIKNVEFEILLIDDGSNDGTTSYLKNLKNYNIFYHEKNLGKGAAIQTGLKHATGDYVLIQDADLEYNPADYKKLIKPILEKNTPIVFGSRFLSKNLSLTKEIYPHHLLGNRLISFLTRILFSSKITDLETGYKLIRTDILKSLNLKSQRFDIEPEITCKLLKKNYPILEVPIEFHPRTFKEGKKITWKDGIKALFLIFKYRFTSQQ